MNWYKTYKQSNLNSLPNVEHDFSFMPTENQPLSSLHGDDEGICLRTASKTMKQLVENGYVACDYPIMIGALSPASYVGKDMVIMHYVAATEIDGVRYIVDDPQINFLVPRTLLDSEPEEGEWREQGDHELENKMRWVIDNYEVTTEELFTGAKNVSPVFIDETFDMPPIFENVRVDNGGYYGSWKGREIRYNPQNYQLEFKTKTLPTENDLFYSRKTFQPKMIPLDIKTIMKEYGVDEATAKQNIQSVQSANMINLEQYKQRFNN